MRMNQSHRLTREGRRQCEIHLIPVLQNTRMQLMTSGERLLAVRILQEDDGSYITSPLANIMRWTSQKRL